MLHPGLYEQVINAKLQSELAEIPQARKETAPIDKAEASRVLSQVAVGPQQRVVTVEVNADGQRAVLVLGVTAQQIQCLHVVKGHAGPAPAPAHAFAAEMAAAQALPRQEGHKDAHA